MSLLLLFMGAGTTPPPPTATDEPGEVDLCVTAAVVRLSAEVPDENV